MKILVKKYHSYKLFFSFALFFALVSVITLSCRRNKDCDVVINVVNGTTNAPVVGAVVHMYPPPTNSNLAIQKQSSTTDPAGIAKFTFTLPAILQTDVTPPTPLGPGSALVKLEEGKEVSKTIKVY